MEAEFGDRNIEKFEHLSQKSLLFFLTVEQTLLRCSEITGNLGSVWSEQLSLKNILKKNDSASFSFRILLVTFV